MDTTTIIIAAVVSVVGGLLVLVAIACLVRLQRARSAGKREAASQAARAQAYLAPPPGAEKIGPAETSTALATEAASESSSSLATALDEDEVSLDFVTIRADGSPGSEPSGDEFIAGLPSVTPLHLDEESRAAVNIQRHFRGYMARREMAHLRRLSRPKLAARPSRRAPDVDLETVIESPSRSSGEATSSTTNSDSSYGSATSVASIQGAMPSPSIVQGPFPSTYVPLRMRYSDAAATSSPSEQIN